jgi:hypothetical protein
VNVVSEQGNRDREIVGWLEEHGFEFAGMAFGKTQRRAVQRLDTRSDASPSRAHSQPHG